MNRLNEDDSTMTDLKTHLPGYQVSELPPTHQELVREEQLDRDTNGVLNSADRDAIQDALDQSSGNERAALQSLLEVATENPSMILTEPGSRSRRTIDDALEAFWRRDSKVQDLSEDVLREASVDQREGVVDELAERDLAGIDRDDEAAILRALETTPFHARAQLLAQISDWRSRLESEVDEGNNNATLREWLANADYLRPDLTAPVRAQRLGQTGAAGQARLLESTPDAQLSELVGALNDRGLLGTVAAAHPDAKPWLAEALALQPIERAIDAATAVGGIDARAGVALLEQLDDARLSTLAQNGALRQLVNRAEPSAQGPLEAAVVERITALEADAVLEAARAWVGFGGYGIDTVNRLLSQASDNELAVLRRDDRLLGDLVRAAAAEEQGAVRRALIDLVLSDTNAHEAAKRLVTLGGFTDADVRSVLASQSASLRGDHRLLRNLADGAPSAQSRRDVIAFVTQDSDAIRAASGLAVIGGFTRGELEAFSASIPADQRDPFIQSDAFAALAAAAPSDDRAFAQAVLRGVALQSNEPTVIAAGLSALGLSEAVLAEAFDALRPRGLDAPLADTLYYDGQLEPFTGFISPEFTWETLADYVYSPAERARMEASAGWQRKQRDYESFRALLPAQSRARADIDDRYHAARSVTRRRDELAEYRQAEAADASFGVAPDGDVQYWLNDAGRLNASEVARVKQDFQIGYYRHDEREAFVEALRAGPLEDGVAMTELERALNETSYSRATMNEALYETALDWNAQGALGTPAMADLLHHYAGIDTAYDEAGQPYSYYYLGEPERLALLELYERGVFDRYAEEQAYYMGIGEYGPSDYDYWP